MKIFPLFAVFFFSLAFCAGCSSDQEIVGSLDAKQSIEIVVQLTRSGIAVKREKTSSGRRELFRITAPSRDYLRALELLHEYGLPRKPESNFENFTSPRSFTPSSPEMSDLRLDYALSQRIERMLSALPGIVETRVLVRSHLRVQSILERSSAQPTATVVVRYSKELPGLLEQVKGIVSKAVPGLEPNAVEVEASRVVLRGDSGLFAPSGYLGDSASGEVVPLAKLTPLFTFRVPEKDVVKGLTQVIFYLLAFCFCGGVLGYVLGAQKTRKKLSKRAKRSSAESKSKSLFIEASFGSQGSPSTSSNVTAGRKESRRGSPGEG